MSSIFVTLLLGGLVLGLLCGFTGLYLLVKRVRGKTTEVQFRGFGKIKTTETGLALMFLGIFFFVYSGFAYDRAKKGEELQTQLDKVLTRTARTLREEFRSVTDNHEPPVKADAFSRVSLLVEVLRQIDATNGHALYYAGEVKRWRGLPRAAHPDFNKYLEVQRTLSENEKGGGTGSEICYEHPRGYCRQRSGWIHHLLANDFYQQGISETDPSQRLFRFRKALKQARDAMRDFPPDGFDQSVPLPTPVLEKRLTKEIEALQKSSLDLR
jgi:hypothetical protein